MFAHCAYAARKGRDVVGLTVKPVGKPDAGNPHVQFDERGGETSVAERPKQARPSSTLLARWLQARGIEVHVFHTTSVAVSREHRRAKTDRLDAAMLMRVFLGWLRGERGHCLGYPKVIHAIFWVGIKIPSTAYRGSSP